MPSIIYDYTVYGQGGTHLVWQALVCREADLEADKDLQLPLVVLVVVVLVATAVSGTLPEVGSHQPSEVVR